MQNYRPTEAKIYLDAIYRNTKKIIQKYPGYQYYVGVVKADCYGYRGPLVVKAMLEGGINFLAASLVEEGLELRKNFKDVPILLLNPAPESALQVCAENRLIVTVTNLKQAKSVLKTQNLQACIRVNGGHDIFGGTNKKDEFETLYHTLAPSLYGIYMHHYDATDTNETMKEMQMFEYLTQDLDLSQLPFISIRSSLSLPRYSKLEYTNACRLGNIVYAIESEDVELESTFQLITRMTNIFTISKGQSIAYDKAYTASLDQEYIAVLPIGFGDGFSKSQIGRNVYINDKEYPIVAVTMDITLVLVDCSIDLDSIVYIVRDAKHLSEIAKHTKGADEEIICLLNKRVRRKYISEYIIE